MCSSAITAKFKNSEKRRRRPAEVHNGDDVTDTGLLGARLDVRALIIQDQRSSGLT